MPFVYSAIGGALLILLSPFLFLIANLCIQISSIPSNLPWAGLKNKRFLPKLRASLREFTAKRDPINEGYDKYGRHGKPFVVGSLLWPEVILPPSQTTWLANQPEAELSSAKFQDAVLSMRYLFQEHDLATMIDFSVIRRDLTRHLSKILPDVMDEIQTAFKSEFDQRLEDWEDVRIVKTIEDLSRRLSNRLFVGLPLCRDKRYTSALRMWELMFGICSAVIRYLVPDFLKPVFAPIVGIPVHFQAWRLRRLVFPIIRQRIAERGRLSDEKQEADKPNDVLQWLLDAKLDGRDPSGMTLHDIAGKTIELNFFSVATVSINTNALLLTILTYPSAPSLLATLREEASQILPKLSTNPFAIREMLQMDSVIRESLRLNVMTGRGLTREVIRPGGVTTPDGLYLPQGTHVSIAVSPRQRDVGGEEFVPFRYCKAEEEGNGTTLDSTARSAVHVTEDFLSFGLAKHACPGRFFAVQALKLILGHLITQYDFEPLAERPENLEIGDISIPSDKVAIKMRKRRTSVP